MKKSIYLFSFMIILFISFTSASISIGDPNHNFTTQYGPIESLKGWLNISFNSESVNNLIRSNFGDSITIKDLFQLNPIVDYSCEPTGCGNTYKDIDSGQTSKQFSLNKGESKIIGLKIVGDYTQQISGFFMGISSNADESIYPPLYIDFFGDGTIEWQSHIPSDNFGSTNYGCYNPPSGGPAIITQRQYCEKIEMHATPSLKVGARVIKNPETTNPASFKFSASSEDGMSYEECIATASASGEISCNLENFIIPESKNIAVCISANSVEDERKYSINSETNSPCGYTDYYTGQYTRDFEIFAKPARYQALPNTIINNTELYNSGMYNYNIEDDILNYIYYKYSGECNNGCIIPIKIISGYQKSSSSQDTDNSISGLPILETQQIINLANLELFYSTDIETSTNKFYEISLTPAKLNSDYVLLNLDDAEFQIPDEFGNHTINIYYGGGTQAIASQEITIQKTPIIKQITPLKTAAGVATKFTVLLNDSNQNISSYNWNFGDNNSATTNTKKVEHTYLKSGTYSLKVTAINEKGFSSSKEINLIVDSPKFAVQQELNIALSNLNSLKSSIETLTAFDKSYALNILNLNEIENKLKEINTSYNSIINESDDSKYIDLMGKLLEINLPSAIKTTSTSSPILFYPDENNINLDLVKEIAGGNYGSREDYINAILIWNQNNLEIKISFNKLSAEYATYEEPLLNTFKLYVNKMSATDTTPYFIIENLENIYFEDSLTPTELDEYFYFPLSSNENTIQFSTTENLDFTEIPAFISPRLSALSIIENPSVNNKTTIFSNLIIVLIILILIAIYFAYTLFKKFKEKKSEISIFKSKHDLDNLIEYISKMRKHGLEEGAIINNLRRSKWRSDQISYAIKKSRKRLGFRLPVEKIIKRLDKKR